MNEDAVAANYLDPAAVERLQQQADRPRGFVDMKAYERLAKQLQATEQRLKCRAKPS